MLTASYVLDRLPSWVPEGAQRYLAHTEAGVSIREIARMSNCHASTILRQVRKMETLRDDPLIDAALRKLGSKVLHSPDSNQKDRMVRHMTETTATKASRCFDDAALDQDSVRILRRLCERGAVLAVATDLDKAVVVRESETGTSQRTAVVERAVAEAMALKDWIAAQRAGRITRYRITSTGRQALEAMLQAAPIEPHSEKQADFAEQHRDWAEKSLPDPESGKLRRFRYNLSESPLTALARRRGKDGQPFLSDDLVSAGERLREDFELAQMGPRVAQNWENFLTGGDRGGFPGDSGIGSGSEAARDRVAGALKQLGPGLGDVALRCCCYLEGLETAEKRLGWSARSGKIVLRIALMQLKRHYESQSHSANLIG